MNRTNQGQIRKVLERRTKVLKEKLVKTTDLNMFYLQENIALKTELDALRVKFGLNAKNEKQPKQILQQIVTPNTPELTTKPFPVPDPNFDFSIYADPNDPLDQCFASCLSPTTESYQPTSTTADDSGD